MSNIISTTPAAGSREAALSDLMSGIYEHAGRYPEDTMGELRSLPTKRDCPDWCSTDHAILFAEGTPLIAAAAHTRYVYESRRCRRCGIRWTVGSSGSGPVRFT